jgi:hypothetical protein
MHPLGPLPNAMWAIGCLFDFPSVENLYIDAEWNIHIKLLYLILWPVFHKQIIFYTVQDQTSLAPGNCRDQDE